MPSNLDGRLIESKYNRSPTALLCPPQEPPTESVPILVSTFTDSSSVVPLKITSGKGGTVTFTSFARFGFRVMFLMQ